MGKRPNPGTPSKPRKRGRKAKNADGDASEDDELVQQQMRRKAILEGNEDDEEWMADFREEGGVMLEDIYIPPKITRSEHPFTGERLVIEKIVCENFKSYGGLKEMGPFHKSFSAIIGPNGNGKSNIIDAMLFVFGYRASKIRCKKVSTLIHQSELLPNVRSCAVTVHFVKIIDEGEKNPTDDFQVVDGSRITVMRRAFAGNDSKYFLDGKAVKFTDVAKFLKTNGIDIVHNRFLILQGEVEQIAQMPPVGRSGNGNEVGLLEFLEEVIGTKRYIKPLAQLDERVEKLDYERDEKLQRVDIAEKEKGALAEPVKKAKDYLRDQNSKTRYQHMMSQKQAYHAQRTVTEKEAAKIELEAKLKELQARLNEISSKNTKRKQEFQQSQAEFKSAEREYAKIKKKFDAADAEFIQLNEELQRTNETRKKLMKEVTKLEKDIEKLIGIPENHQKDIEQLTKRKLELDVDIKKEESAVKGDLEKLNVKVDEALKKKEVVDKEFAKLKAIRDGKKSAVDKLQKELVNYKEREVVERKKLEGLEADLEKLKESIGRKEREGRTSMGNNNLKKMETKIQELHGQEKELIEVENGKRNTLEQARGDYQSAQESLDGNSQLDRTDRFLLEAKADGMFPGLYGRMKNLAKIPEKYNVAATMSTGLLEYWVTDNDNTAGNCIKFLREKDLPVQNFICLTRLQNHVRSAKERFDTPAQSHRIFDLLEISSPELVPAYYKAFRNTLVADNIDIATKVSFGGSRRHRVVTLLGEIVEATGSMVGGGRQRMEGKFNSKKSGISVTKQQMATLKQRLDEAQKEFQQAQEAREDATKQVRALNEQIQDFKRKMNTFHSDMAALKAQLPLKEANVESQRKKVKECSTSPKIMKEKEDIVAKALAEYEEAQEPCEEAEENARKLAEKVHELQVTKKKEITKKLDKFIEQRKKVEEEMNRKIVELKNCETNRKKTEKKLANVRQEIINLQASMEKRNERRKKVEADAKEIKEQEKELSERVEETKKVFEDLQAHAHEFQKEENSLSKEKLGLENELSDAVGEVCGCQQLLKSLTESIKNLDLHEIPEEEVEPLKVLTEDEIKVLPLSELDRKVKKYAEKLRNRQAPNLNILDEYRTKVNLLFQRIRELDEITKQRDMFREAYGKLDQQRTTEFMEGFALISSRLKEMFRMISMGGDAELEVADILDLFGCGIEFSVRPARKTWKKISNLSGGEKTLASLSLVFALHHFKPSPFYVMDEIDAALDFKNVSIIANYIKDRTKFTQFIIISLRSNMFELADSLLGVYKVDNMSYSIHIGVKKLVTELKNKYERRPTDSQPSQDRRISQGEAQSQPTRTSKDPKENARPGFPSANVSEIFSDDGEELAGTSAAEIGHGSQSQQRSKADDTAESESSSEATIAQAPPGPSTQLAQSSSQGTRTNPTQDEGSEDMFGDMDVDENGSPVPVPGPGPIAASTPFVGRRVSTYARPRSSGHSSAHTPPSNEIPMSDEDQPVADAERPQIEMEVSPIRKSHPSGYESNGNDDHDDSFKTAEDEDQSYTDDDFIGPTQ